MGEVNSDLPSVLPLTVAEGGVFFSTAYSTTEVYNEHTAAHSH